MRFMAYTHRPDCSSCKFSIDADTPRQARRAAVKYAEKTGLIIDSVNLDRAMVRTTSKGKVVVYNGLKYVEV